MKKLLLIALLWLIPSPLWAEGLSDSKQANIVKATLLARTDAITPGEKLQLGLLIEPKKGWHTYWENPGDAGMPTTMSWTLPDGFTASAIDWPVPQRLAEGPLVTFSYVDAVFLPVTITVPSTLSYQTYPIKLKAEWLVCEDICVPESVELSLIMPVTEAKLTTTRFDEWFGKNEKAHAVAVDTPGGYTTDGKTLTLSIPASALNVPDIQSAYFFPREANLVQYPAEQKLTSSSGVLELELASTSEKPEGNVSGLLTVTAGATKTKTFDVTFKSGSAAASGAPGTPKEGFLSAALLAALLGGLILNLMPCVLPVLSLKALAIAKKAGQERGKVIRLGIAYTLGILISFAVIAGILISLQQGGQAVGWGYQMQSPAFVGFLIYLLFMVGLSLSGVFHLPVLLGGVGGADDSSVRGSFFTGVLATAVATPCTAPFMAGAVGVALTLPPAQAMLIFEALGFGLALPFLLISLFPFLLRFLPKPGAWMDTFKQLLAFPMYASVIWLLWVLTLQTGPGGMVVALCGMLAGALVIWMKALFTDGGGAYRFFALLGFFCILVLSLPALSRMEISTAALPGGHAEHGVTTVEYSKEKLDELRAAGTPVFVDATAAWCITCQVNARVALHTERTMTAFKEQGVTLMIADWTRRNESITRFLASFGFNGVPLNVFYPAKGGKPVVLPQILTEDIIIDALKQ